MIQNLKPEDMGKTPINIIGASPTMTTSVSEYWDKAGAYAFMAAAAGLEVVSSSADDKGTATAGTGARTVVLEYLTTGFVVKTETITLNGTAAVPTTATDIYRINKFYVATTGTGLVPAGNISLRTLTTGAVTYAYILAGQNFARQAIYTVPVGRTLYVQKMICGYGQTTGIQHYTSAYIMANQFNGAATTLFYQYPRVFFDNVGGVVDFGDYPLKFIAGTDIKVSGLSSQAGIAEVTLSGWVE